MHSSVGYGSKTWDDNYSWGMGWEHMPQGLNQVFGPEAADTVAGMLWNGQNVLEKPVPPMEWGDYWQLTCWHCRSTCHCTVLMNWMTTTDAGGERTDTWVESWSQWEEMIDAAGMLQQPIYIGSEHPGDYIHQGPSTTGWTTQLLAVWGVGQLSRNCQHSPEEHWPKLEKQI
jgi:hypothetical protein